MYINAQIMSEVLDYLYGACESHGTGLKTQRPHCYATVASHSTLIRYLTEQ